MQEQPPSDPPRREPTGNARRGRSPKATFTPPPSPEPAVPPARQPGAEEASTPGRRRTQPAPPVLFQPPQSDQAAGDAAPPRPRPTPADAAPTGPVAEDRGTKSTRAGSDGQPEGAVSEPAAGEERKTPGRTTPKKATPAPRKRAGSPAGKPAEPAGDLPHLDAEAGGAEPTGPVSSATTPVPEPESGPEIVTSAPAGPMEPGSEAKTPANAPRKTAPRGTTAKKTGTAAKKTGPARKTGTTRKVGATAPMPPDAPETPAAEALPSAVTEPAAMADPPELDAAVEPARSASTTVEPAVVEAAGANRADTVAVAPRTPGVELRAVRARVLDHPGFAPELLALAAVEALGPRAREWAERLREAYPDADADGLARLAARRFVRLAGTGGAVSALAGLFAPVAELATVLWTQANLVLHLAAAYGRDPAHPDRAVELLVLTRVHPDADSAKEALDAARAADGPGAQPWPRAAEAAWRLAAPLAAQAGGWLGLRLASRVLPGAAALAAAAGNAAATERLAARAVGHYRPARVR